MNSPALRRGAVCALTPPEARIKQITQRISHQVERQHCNFAGILAVIFALLFA